jgi:hypothetical protein
MNANRIVACFAALVAFATCPTAHAQLFRAYVSSTGLDTNPCSLQQPCRLLPAALTVVADGGEIWMLDSANYNTSSVIVTKSVTILAIPGAVGSLVSTGSLDALSINASGIKVTLRNLVFVHLTASGTGVNFVQGAQLGISNCEFANIQGTAIYAQAAGATVAIRDTVIRGTGASIGVLASGDVAVSLDNVHSKQHDFAVRAILGARVTVSNSVLSGSAYGVYAHSTGSATTRLVIAHSTISGNFFGIRAQTDTAGATVTVTARNNNLSHNSSAAVSAWQTASSTVNVVLEGNTLVENNAGVQFASGTPIVYTRSNNTFRFNTPDLSGGALTNLAAQ